MESIVLHASSTVSERSARCLDYLLTFQKTVCGFAFFLDVILKRVETCVVSTEGLPVVAVVPAAEPKSSREVIHISGAAARLENLIQGRIPHLLPRK